MNTSFKTLNRCSCGQSNLYSKSAHQGMHNRRRDGHGFRPEHFIGAVLVQAMSRGLK